MIIKTNKNKVKKKNRCPKKKVVHESYVIKLKFLKLGQAACKNGGLGTGDEDSVYFNSIVEVFKIWQGSTANIHNNSGNGQQKKKVDILLRLILHVLHITIMMEITSSMNAVKCLYGWFTH